MEALKITTRKIFNAEARKKVHWNIFVNLKNVYTEREETDSPIIEMKKKTV